MELDLSRYSGKCACGKEHIIKTGIVIIDSGATGRFRETIERLGLLLGGCALCDTKTRRYADAVTDKILPLMHSKKPVVVLDSDGLRANERAIAEAEEMLPEDATFLIAAGTGTIHDITRYIAKKRKIPFISYPTACTNDGFASMVCTLTRRGFKNTVLSSAPLAVIADTDVLLSAPYRLTTSGIGEMLGKYTALADWKCAALLADEDFCDKIYSMTENAVTSVREYLPAIHAGDKDAYEKLMLALILSGVAMQMWGDSRPASGFEHHLSHFWEMGIINPVPDSLHGERVGVGLLCTLRYYGKIFRLEKIASDIQPYSGMPLPLMRKHLGTLYEDILKVNQPDPLRGISIDKVRENFPGLKQIIKDLPDPRKLRPFMQATGCLTTMEEVGLNRDILTDSLILAPFVRRRITIMRMSKIFNIQL